MKRFFGRKLVLLTALTTLAWLPAAPGATLVTNWVAYNDHNSGAGTAANATTYSLTQSGNVGQPVGGPMKDFNSGANVSVNLEVTSAGYINGTTGSSTAPNAGTPADQIFGGKIAWLDSALYFSPSPYTAKVVLTFTNLTPGAKYSFRGAAVRGNSYATRWSLATISDISSATAAHITGVGSPGIVTNGWSPYGDTLVPNLQAAWNSGENRVGDVIGWDEIIPLGNSFSVVCSNWTVATPSGGGNTTYCYAFAAIELTELIELGPVEITQQPVAATNVEEYAAWSINVRVSGALAGYQWYKGDFATGVAIAGATSATYSQTSASLADAGNYFVIITNSESSVTSTVSQVTVYVNPIVITQQPTNHVTALELRPFDLSVTVTGTHPQYQWYKDNAPLADATNRTYSVASASVNDVGNYFVIITNSLHAATSSVTQVTYSSDAQAPVVQRVVGSGSGIQVTIEFDEALAPLVAADTGYYSFTPFLDIYTAELTNASTVVLTTAPQDPATTYSLTINALDLVGNYGGTNVDFHPWVPNRSGVSFEVYATGGGSAVSNLTAHASFPNSPKEAYILDNFGTTNLWPNVAPANTAANREGYGGRLRGLFIPSISGNWRFFISSDDESELWLNTNGVSASGTTRIAGAVCCNPFPEPGATTQASQPFTLVAGQPYYLEALYKEGTGGDFCLVAARRDGDPTPATNLFPITFSMGYPNLPAGVAGVASIIQQPAASTSVEAPGSITLSVLGSNSLNAPFTYQWQQSDGVGGFTNLPNANLKSLSRSGLIVADSTQFRCIVAAGDSSATSTVASVTVTPDATGPSLLSAIRDLNLTNILLTFSEPLAANATTTGNYLICDAFVPNSCVQVISAVLTNGDTAVLLETALPDLAGIYQVTVNNVTDTNLNVIRPPNSMGLTAATSFQQGVNGYTGGADTQIMQGNAANNYGAQAVLLVDASDSGGAVQVLMAFNNLFGNGASQIPPGATINSARLRLFSITSGANSPGPISFHLMLTNWDASSVTWNSIVSGVQTNDVEATTQAFGSIVADFTDPGGTTWVMRDVNVTTSVQAWATGQKANYGWLLNNPNTDGYRFSGDNDTNALYHPLLVVNYTPSTTANPVQIVGQPAATQTINEGQSASFTVSVTGTRPEYQWYKDNTLLPGAIGATYTVTNAVETNAGRYFCIISNLMPSIVQSADALLAVLPDTNAPVLVSALGTTNANVITLTFSEKMDATLISDVSHYGVTPTFGGSALAIQNAALSSNGLTVTLTTDARTPFVYYTLTVQNLTDAAYRHNVQNPNPTKLFLGSQVSLIAPASTWRYHELGVDLGTGWTAGNYVDDETAGWSNGVALFVGKNGTPGNGDIPILTTLAMTNNAPGYYTNTITYYFRQHFTMPAAAQLIGLQSYHLQVHPILDDGAVFHINGQPARYVRMTNDPVVYTSYAQAPGQGNDYRFEGPYNLPTTNVNFGGDNVMAVEVHQINATSSDIAFAAEVLITVPPLEMRLTSPPPTPGNFTINWPAVPGFHLYEADKVEGPYTPVAGDPSGTYAVSTALAKGKFYQVRSP